MLTNADVFALQAVASVELSGVFHKVDVHYCNDFGFVSFFMIATIKPAPVSEHDVRAYSMDYPDDYEHACDILEREIGWILEDETGDMRLYPAEWE